jgi:TRAP-type C4-dicarboxylate transport system permease small subunit
MLKTIAVLSYGIERIERMLIRVIVLALPLMILANAAGRALRSPIYWMDELAILTMVWLAMVAMSLTLKTRDAVAVTMLIDVFPSRLVKVMKVTVDLLVLAFGLIMVVLSWYWFDPLTLMQFGFDTHEFAGETFNFMYQDTTSTLGLQKFWFWLVVPISALCTCIHGFFNLTQTLVRPLDADGEAATPKPLTDRIGV